MVSSASFFLNFPLTLFFGIFSAPSVWSALSPLLGSLLGISLVLFPFSEALPLSLCPLAVFGIFRGRCSSWFLWRRLVGWVSFRQSQLLSPLLGRTSSCLTFLSFGAKLGPESCPLPRSFCVRSLADFVGVLPDKLLLCPVRALRIYLVRTASLPSRPCAVFVSPRAPSRPLSKNALSFFICDVIAESYSLSGLSLPSVSSSSSSTLSAVCLFFSSSFFGACSWGSGCCCFLGFSSYCSFVFCLGGRCLVSCLCLYFFLFV